MIISVWCGFLVQSLDLVSFCWYKVNDVTLEHIRDGCFLKCIHQFYHSLHVKFSIAIVSEMIAYESHDLYNRISFHLPDVCRVNDHNGNIILPCVMIIPGIFGTPLKCIAWYIYLHIFWLLDWSFCRSLWCPWRSSWWWCCCYSCCSRWGACRCWFIRWCRIVWYLGRSRYWYACSTVSTIVVKCWHWYWTGSW